MAEYLIQSESLTSIADEIRTLSGTTDTMSLGDMVDNVNIANGNINTEASLIAQIQTALQGKAAGGNAEPTLQDKTVTPTTSKQTITPDSGYDGLSQVTVNAMPTATQATPSVSIDSAGKITATATQTAGYVSAGTKTGTKQLTTQAAKTVTPSTSSQTAVASGVYTTGAVTVAAIPSKYVDNSTVTAIESDVMSGKKYGAAGAVKTGTFSLDTELSTQESLISQIATALQGKASGAGSGSGGASVETCTVEVLNYCYEEIDLIIATVIENGAEQTFIHKYESSNHPPYVINNVKCGSAVVVVDNSYYSTLYTETEGGASLIDAFPLHGTGNSVSIYIFSAPTVAGAYAKVVACYEP